MYSYFFKIYFLFIIIILIISFFTIFLYSSGSSIFSDNTTLSQFYWPLPGNKNITSYFGKRNSPTSGASTSHSGIDIAAPEGTPIYNCISGKVTFVGFKGAGGCTLTIENNNISVSYCHISPKYLFKIGDFVAQKNIIANVGPKNIYGIINNPYTDSMGNPTNGATTGSHLHLTIKKDGIAVNPLTYF
jgi:murein DD-endopeptidase MepM/ murein hydrolase activator NlpD